jgi:hypothetical protein
MTGGYPTQVLSLSYFLIVDTTRAAGGLFQIVAGILFELGYIGRCQVGRQSESARQLAYKDRIAARFFAAQTVIEVEHA